MRKEREIYIPPSTSYTLSCGTLTGGHEATAMSLLFNFSRT